MVSAVLLTAPLHWRIAAVEQRLLGPWLGPDYLGDGRPASELLLCYPMGLALNDQGELLISDRGRDRRGRVIWRIDQSGMARHVAGSGRRGNASESSASDIRFDKPESLAVAPDGSVLVSDGFNHSIFRIGIDGTIERLAGDGTPGYAGDGGPASAARLHRPADIRFDGLGNLYVADIRNQRIRRIDQTGQITTVAGNGTRGFSPDGTRATTASIDMPWGIAIDTSNRLVIADGGNHRVRRVETDGRLTTIAGNGVQNFGGDGGLAVDASMNFPEGLAYDADGRLFIGDELNHAVRRVDLDGRISTVIGVGAAGYADTGAAAVSEPLDDPQHVIIDAQGDLIVADGGSGRVLRVSSDGIVHLVAGRGDIARCSSIF